MNFLRKNALLLGMSATFIVLLLGSLYFLKGKVEELGLVKQEVENKKAAREGLWREKPFISLRTVDLIRSNAVEGMSLASEALKPLHQSSISVQPMDRLKWKEDLFAACNRMSQQLKKANIKHNPDQKFGFQAYANAAPSRDQDTVLLQKQLKIVEELVGLCAKAFSKNDEIHSIQRMEFEKFPHAGRELGLSPINQPLISMGKHFAYINAPGYLYSTMPFEMEVTCTTEGFRNFLNILLRSKHVFLVRLFTVVNIEKGPRPNKFETKGTAASAPTASSPEGAEPSQPQPPPKQEAVDMIKRPFEFGKKELIKVSMRIEWLEFNEERAVKERGKGKKKGADHKPETTDQ